MKQDGKAIPKQTSVFLYNRVWCNCVIWLSILVGSDDKEAYTRECKEYMRQERNTVWRIFYRKNCIRFIGLRMNIKWRDISRNVKPILLLVILCYYLKSYFLKGVFVYSWFLQLTCYFLQCYIRQWNLCLFSPGVIVTQAKTRTNSLVNWKVFGQCHKESVSEILFLLIIGQ